MLAKAVARWAEVLKNLQEAAGSRETVSTSMDVTTCKVEIEQTRCSKKPRRLTTRQLLRCTSN
jgi:hypothetical protein